MQSGRTGGILPAVLNSAKELAVSAFLAERIKFAEIWRIVADTMSQHRVIEHAPLDAIIAADAEARERESVARERLDYPHYTRPREFRDLPVPEVLLSGDHARIERWRRARAYERTLARRPDLVAMRPKEPGEGEE